MLFIVLIIVIVIGFIYALRNQQGLSRNEKLYLKRRGYEPPAEFEERPQVSKDTRLLGAIESLSTFRRSLVNAPRKIFRECANRAIVIRECCRL